MIKIHKTKRYERHRVRLPGDFIKSSLRTHDIGRVGFSKRIGGRLKSTGKWSTQAFLISHDEPFSMKQQLRKQAKERYAKNALSRG